MAALLIVQPEGLASGVPRQNVEMHTSLLAERRTTDNNEPENDGNKRCAI